MAGPVQVRSLLHHSVWSDDPVVSIRSFCYSNWAHWCLGPVPLKPKLISVIPAPRREDADEPREGEQSRPRQGEQDYAQEHPQDAAQSHGPLVADYPQEPAQDGPESDDVE